MTMAHPEISPDALSEAVNMASIQGGARFDFPSGMLHGARRMAAEEQRTRLIGEIASLLNEGSVPADARAAGLTLIGWLARRMPGEAASQAGVKEMRRRSMDLGCRPERMNGRRSR
jgi:hypothetical protein